MGEDSFVYYLATGTRYYQSTNDVATLWLLDYGGGGGRFLCPYYLATGTRYYQSTNIGTPPGRKPVFHGHSVVAELQQQCNPPGGVPVCDGLAASLYIITLRLSVRMFPFFSKSTQPIFPKLCTSLRYGNAHPTKQDGIWVMNNWWDIWIIDDFWA